MYKPSSEAVFASLEVALIATLTNPVSAATSATVRTLTNPFKSNRKSFKRYYGENRQYSNFVQNTDIIVKSCCECDAAVHGVETQFHSAGSRSSWSGNKVYERDTFCSTHITDALKAQSIVKMALGY